MKFVINHYSQTFDGVSKHNVRFTPFLPKTEKKKLS